MRSKPVGWVIVGAILLSACSAKADLATPTAPSSTRRVTAASTPPGSPSSPVPSSPHAPAAIRLPGLPEQGVAVERRGAVELHGFFHGRLLARLPGFHIYHPTAQPSNLVLQGGGVFYALGTFGRELRPLPSRRAADRWVGPQDESGVDLPIPQAAGKPMVGHWRYSTNDSRYYGRVMAQWSGECEVPIAFFFDGDEGELVPVTGEPDPADAPESFALGWNVRGQAVVFLPEGACGGSADPPGVYLFRKAGEGRLLVRTGRLAAARMWGTTVAG